jgi:hypothetical protein
MPSGITGSQEPQISQILGPQIHHITRMAVAIPYNDREEE